SALFGLRPQQGHGPSPAFGIFPHRLPAKKKMEPGHGHGKNPLSTGRGRLGSSRPASPECRHESDGSVPFAGEISFGLLWVSGISDQNPLPLSSFCLLPLSSADFLVLLFPASGCLIRLDPPFSPSPSGDIPKAVDLGNGILYPNDPV